MGAGKGTTHMTLEYIFDAFLAKTKHGGRLRRETSTDHVRAFLQRVEVRAQDLISAARREIPSLPDIHFDFISNSQVNAVAFKESRCYFIGFYAGTLMLLHQLVGRLLADGRIFPHIGNAAAERCDWEPLPYFSRDALVMLDLESPRFPTDPARQQYAEFLEHQATMFLVGHELVHIVSGHVDYLNARWQQPMTVELGGLTGQGENALIERQSLEHHADTRSIYSRIDSLRFTFTNPARQIPLWRPDATHAVHLLADWAVSVNLIFHLFGDLRFIGALLEHTSHPPLAVRRATCDGMAYAAVQEKFGAEWLPVAREALLLARGDTDLAFATMFGTKVRPGPSREEAHAIDAHARRLSACLFDELMPALRPFAYES